jgi:general stress protein 26
VKDTEDARTHLFRIATGFEVGMLATIAVDGHLHGRPMAIADLSTEDGAIWFLAQRDSEPCTELGADARALVTLQGHGSYVQCSGRASLVDDRIRLHEIWHPRLLAWFPQGPEDPRLVMIRVDVEIGEYWDASGAPKLRALMARARQAISGRGAAATQEDDPATHARLQTNGRTR